MINYSNKCIIQAAENREIDILCHGCNCFATMGAGVAKQIAEVFPEAYEADRKDSRYSHVKLGSYSHYSYDHVRVVNLYTQYRYGRNKAHAEYAAIKSALTEMIDDFDMRDREVFYQVGMVKIGCGLGGLDWDIVSDIIDYCFLGVKSNVTVYTGGGK